MHGVIANGVGGEPAVTSPPHPHLLLRQFPGRPLLGRTFHKASRTPVASASSGMAMPGLFLDQLERQDGAGATGLAGSRACGCRLTRAKNGRRSRRPSAGSNPDLAVNPSSLPESAWKRRNLRPSAAVRPKHEAAVLQELPPDQTPSGPCLKIVVSPVQVRSRHYRLLLSPGCYGARVSSGGAELILRGYEYQYPRERTGSDNESDPGPSPPAVTPGPPRPGSGSFVLNDAA